jgi:hypothetical protein
MTGTPLVYGAAILSSPELAEVISNVKADLMLS